MQGAVLEQGVYNVAAVPAEISGIMQNLSSFQLDLISRESRDSSGE
jgi:hypothetical protein